MNVRTITLNKVLVKGECFDNIDCLKNMYLYLYSDLQKIKSTNIVEIFSTTMKTMSGILLEIAIPSVPWKGPKNIRGCSKLFSNVYVMQKNSSECILRHLCEELERALPSSPGRLI